MGSTNNRATLRLKHGGIFVGDSLRQTRAMTVAAAGAAAAVLFGGCYNDGRSAADSGDVTAPTTTDVSVPAPAVVAEFDLPADSQAPVFTPGHAWIPTAGGKLIRVDAETNTSEVVRKGHGMAWTSAMSASDSIWLSHEGKGLFRLDPDTGAVIAHIPEDIGINSGGFGSLWGMAYGHKVLRIDPNTNQVVARLRVSENEEETHATGCMEPFRATCPDYLTVHEDRVVVFIDGEDTIVHIDPATNQVTKRVKMPATASGFFRLYGDVPWIMTESGLAQVDIDSGEVLKRIPLEVDQRALSFPAVYYNIAIHGDTAWLVADYRTTEIDLKRGEIVKTFETPGSYTAGSLGVIGASFGHGDLWVSYAGGTVQRLDLSES